MKNSESGLSRWPLSGEPQIKSSSRPFTAISTLTLRYRIYFSFTSGLIHSTARSKLIVPVALLLSTSFSEARLIRSARKRIIQLPEEEFSIYISRETSKSILDLSAFLFDSRGTTRKYVSELPV